MSRSNVKSSVAVAVVAPSYPTEAELAIKGAVNLSQRIRAYASLGMSTAMIAKTVTRSNGEHPRYQHVRNVLNTQLKRVETVSTPASASGSE